MSQRGRRNVARRVEKCHKKNGGNVTRRVREMPQEGYGKCHKEGGRNVTEGGRDVTRRVEG